MSEEDVYIGETSIQIGQHGFINQPKETIEYIKKLQKENEFLKLSNPEMNLEHWRVVNENKRKIDNLRKHNKQLKDQLQQKENIIKEVREYIEKNTEEKKSWLNGIPDYIVFKGDTKELLEILEKERELN